MLAAKTRRIEPRWREYVLDRSEHLAAFISSLREDHYRYETTYKMRFSNPAVSYPIMRADLKADEANTMWKEGRKKPGDRLADQAAWAQVESLYGLMQTCSGVLTIDAIECVEKRFGGDKPMTEELRWLTEAQQAYASAISLSVPFDELPTYSSINRCDRALQLFDVAIHAAGRISPVADC